MSTKKLHDFWSISVPQSVIQVTAHKPILPLTLLDAVDHGLIDENFVMITPKIASLFRHALFPFVVKNLYGQACAVCQADTRTDTGRMLLDAAHILPFAKHHNDDPRNGLALCKNHHWGFDAGAFAVADDYKIVISKRIIETIPLVTARKKLTLPTSPEYAPAVEALRWHRQNVFLR